MICRDPSGGGVRIPRDRINRLYEFRSLVASHIGVHPRSGIHHPSPRHHLGLCPVVPRLPFDPSEIETLCGKERRRSEVGEIVVDPCALVELQRVLRDKVDAKEVIGDSGEEEGNKEEEPQSF